MTKIFKVSASHIIELASNIRKEDAKECRDILGLTPLDAIKSSVMFSEEAYTVWDGGTLALLGVVPPSLLGVEAQPWLLTSNLSTKKSKEFLKWPKLFIERWIEKWPVLVNHIDAEYTKSLRWAKWSGFTIHEPEPYGVKQIPCCKVEIRRD